MFWFAKFVTNGELFYIFSKYKKSSNLIIIINVHYIVIKFN